MAEAFVPFWRLRSAGVVEDLVRGRGLRRRAGEWPMDAAVREQLRPLLEAAGLDPSAEIFVSERADEDGFRLRQG